MVCDTVPCCSCSYSSRTFARVASYGSQRRRWRRKDNRKYGITAYLLSEVWYVGYVTCHYSLSHSLPLFSHSTCLPLSLEQALHPMARGRDTVRTLSIQYVTSCVSRGFCDGLPERDETRRAILWREPGRAVAESLATLSYCRLVHQPIP